MLPQIVSDVRVRHEPCVRTPTAPSAGQPTPGRAQRPVQIPFRDRDGFVRLHESDTESAEKRIDDVRDQHLEPGERAPPTSCVDHAPRMLGSERDRLGHHRRVVVGTRPLRPSAHVVSSVPVDRGIDDSRSHRCHRDGLAPVHQFSPEPVKRSFECALGRRVGGVHGESEITTTCAPDRANRIAVSRPIPLEPPVTTTI